MEFLAELLLLLGELIRLDRFAYGFLFAFAMTVVRFTWAGPAAV